jgi:acyl-CoA reductase-like NAD-dependent aldehyde dehydrogenase
VAQTALERLSYLSGRHLVDGQFIAGKGDESIDVIDPATEARIGHFVSATDAEIDAAVAVANAAQKKWRKVNALTRAELMHEAARRMRDARPRVAEMLTREMGKTYKESADETSWSWLAIDYYAEVGRHENGRVLGPTVDTQVHLVTKDPLGVCVLILPYNYPLCLLCWQAGAALATGNAVIIKPSELTTLTTLEFCDALQALPPGLVQVVAGSGAVGRRLVEHADTHMVAFTGGIETGRRVAETCARQYKRCLVETSGNDPFIVMPSAPLDVAARGAAFGAFLNCGQVCAASERFYVHRDIYRRFSELLVEETRKVRVGNGLERVDMGPLASAAQRDRYETMLRRGIESGGKVAVGGVRPAGLKKGWFCEPTVLLDVPASSPILNDESFGPVAPLCPVASFDEAIELANRSRYGLGSTIYTTDLNESMRAVAELEAGMVWVNAPLLDNNAGPFGGRKQSGMGRQLGSEGLDTFRHTKFSMIDPACSTHDFWWFPYSDAESYPGPKVK